MQSNNRTVLFSECICDDCQGFKKSFTILCWVRIRFKYDIILNNGFQTHDKLAQEAVKMCFAPKGNLLLNWIFYRIFWLQKIGWEVHFSSVLCLFRDNVTYVYKYDLWAFLTGKMFNTVVK